MTYFILFSVSLISSIAGAICGIGGGVIIKPVVDFLNIMDVNKVSFLSSCTVFAMAAYTFIKSKIAKDSLVDMRISTPLAVGAAFGGLLGKHIFRLFFNILKDYDLIGALQSSILIMLVIITILYIAMKNKIPSYKIKNVALCILIGIVLGFLSSFLGIGGGPFNIMFLYLFFTMNTKEAAQNSLYIILFSQLTSILSSILNFETLEDINIIFLIVMVLAGILGGIIGRIIYKKIDANKITALFITLLFVIMSISIYNFIRFIK